LGGVFFFETPRNPWRKPKNGIPDWELFKAQGIWTRGRMVMYTSWGKNSKTTTRREGPGIASGKETSQAFPDRQRAGKTKKRDVFFGQQHHSTIKFTNTNSSYFRNCSGGCDGLRLKREKVIPSKWGPCLGEKGKRKGKKKTPLRKEKKKATQIGLGEKIDLRRKESTKVRVRKKRVHTTDRTTDNCIERVLFQPEDPHLRKRNNTALVP